MDNNGAKQQWGTIVIGGGQAGLACGYQLAKLGEDFVIIDQEARVGDAWRKRWDSLQLFTPSQYDGLPGMPFPRREERFRPKTRWRTIWKDTHDGSHCLSVREQV